MAAEALITDRLTLAPVTRAHAASIFACFDERVTKYMYPSPAKELSETERLVDRFIEEHARGTDYVFAIALKDGGEFIGLAGLHRLQSATPELGIWTKTAAHGHHYGREAIGALISLARSLKYESLLYPVDRRNIPSAKIPQYYGGAIAGELVETPTADGRTLEIITYRIKL
ncbi:MAG: GNAT family N-acetyltransferase [Clostridia bacterium]|nr:GNAT family N-acetyltransferase [Clostridia bacterium]